jgi:hypothetical protein
MYNGGNEEIDLGQFCKSKIINNAEIKCNQVWSLFHILKCMTKNEKLIYS